MRTSGFAKLLARGGDEAKIGFRSIHISSGMPAATRWRIRGSIPERWAYLGHRWSTTRYAALAPGGSKTSGARRSQIRFMCKSRSNGLIRLAIVTLVLREIPIVP